MLYYVWWLRRYMYILHGGYWISPWEKAAYSQLKHRLGAWSLSPQTLWQHSCCFPWSWIKPLAHSSYRSSSNTRCLTSASRHKRDFDLFIKILPAANRSAFPCFILICLYNHPCCLDEGLISMPGILLCARSLYSSWNFEDILWC